MKLTPPMAVRKIDQWVETGSLVSLGKSHWHAMDMGLAEIRPLPSVRTTAAVESYHSSEKSKENVGWTNVE
jgi:hypothetical protein